MSFDIDAHQREIREHYLSLARHGVGWHPYVLNAAEQLVKCDPELYVGLVAAIEAEIGPEATADAHRILVWFCGRGKG